VVLALDGWHLVTVDSGQRHANAGDAADGYNRRRAECARACELLGIESLREATAELASGLPEPLSRRALHVITENERVRETVIALEGGDLKRVGTLLNESHASLRDRYEISTPAVERAVAQLLSAGARGARIVGGGFGGYVSSVCCRPAPACREGRSRSHRRPARGCCERLARVGGKSSIV
jgi:galactokinase